MAHIWVPQQIVIPTRTIPKIGWHEASGRDPADGLGSVAPPAAPAPSNIFDGYTWDVAYSGEDALAGSWPEAGGSSAYNVTTTGTLTLNQSTSGLTTAGGIGATRENRAVSLATGAGQGLLNASGWNMVAGNRHVRGLMDTTGVSNNARIYMYLVGGTRWCETRWLTSSGGTYYQYARYDGSGGIYAVSITTIGAGWHLYDMTYEPSGGVSGFAQFRIYVDGTDYTPAEHTAALDPANGADEMGIWARGNGTTIFNSEALFQGWMFGSSISLSSHQTDATAVGL